MSHLQLSEHLDHLTIDLASNQYGELLLKIMDSREKELGIVPQLSRTPRFFDQSSGRIVEPVPWDKFARIRTFFVSRLSGTRLPVPEFVPPPILHDHHVWQNDELAFFEQKRVHFDANRRAEMEEDLAEPVFSERNSQSQQQQRQHPQPQQQQEQAMEQDQPSQQLEPQAQHNQRSQYQQPHSSDIQPTTPSPPAHRASLPQESTSMSKTSKYGKPDSSPPLPHILPMPHPSPTPSETGNWSS